MAELDDVRHLDAPARPRASLTTLLRKAGDGSPLIAPAVYVGGLVVSNTAAALAPNMLAAVIMLAIWPTVSLFLFVVVTWFRDDDWLAAGFLIGIPVLLGGFIADIVAQTVVGLSVGAAVLGAPGAIMAVGLRSLLFVPLCGGLVTLARLITKRVRRQRSPVR